MLPKGGNISTFWIKPDGVIKKIWPKVLVKGHADKVFQALVDNVSAGALVT